MCYGARASYICMLRYVHFALFTMKVNSGMICLVLNKLFLYCCVGDGAVDGVHEQLRIENMLCIKITISNLSLESNHILKCTSPLVIMLFNNCCKRNIQCVYCIIGCHA